MNYPILHPAPPYVPPVLEAAKGAAASLLQFAMTVPSLQQRLRTHEQMVADGWFPEPQI